MSIYSICPSILDMSIYSSEIDLAEVVVADGGAEDTPSSLDAHFGVRQRGQQPLEHAPRRVRGLFRVQGSGCRVQGSGCRVQGAWCRVQGARCRVQVAGCRVQGSRCRAEQADIGYVQPRPSAKDLNPVP